MFRILESQAPAKQTATDTISTLSSRLQSATLLEDRRAAILGLRSFAKGFPASVASGSLRNLINSLSSDGEDVDTTKIVLETLLMLFSPDETSPEASDEISLWLADEFTQRQENITVLLDILDRQEFFCRLHALQLLSAITSARPERTQECVYTAPLGVSRLVAVLEDKREAIQNEGLVLLIALTPTSPDLQKLVAFENAFDRIFAIIESEGSLGDGGVIVQDCLSLLANLLRLNTSNQSFFRETGGIPKIATILRSVAVEDGTNNVDGMSDWMSPQRNKNVWGFLSVIRLFLQGTSTGTQMNQTAFWQSNVTDLTLQLGFRTSLSPAIRSEALFTCADLVRSNASLQEKFAQREVTMQTPESRAPSTAPSSGPNGQSKEPKSIAVNVIQALLDVGLAVSVQETLDVRLAACECLKAYLQGHAQIRMYFLHRAREGHLSKDQEPDNIFTILIEDGANSVIADPIRLWIASVLLFHLLYEDHDAKKLAMDIAEGNADEGEEVVTCIQAISGNLITCAQRGNDDRITVAYLSLLCGWLYEDPDGINDFLQEGSHVQSLIQLVLHPASKALEAGLSAFLLGTIYEFSTKDSPIPRSKLHEILTNRLGREQYVDKMTKLREHPFVRDFEVLPSTYTTDQFGGHPEMHFDKHFVEFLKDNFSRMLRSLDREPGIEVPVMANGVQKGVSRELVDSLKSQLEDKSKALSKAESEILTLEHRLGQEQAEMRKARESTHVEINRIKSINESLQRNHEEEASRIQKDHQRAFAALQQTHEGERRALQQQHNTDMAEQKRHLESQKNGLESQISKLQREHEAWAKNSEESTNQRAVQHQTELEELKAALQNLEKRLDKSTKDHAQDLKTAHEEYASDKKSLAAQAKLLEERAEAAEKRAVAAEEMAKEKEAARASTQTELDDLFMVLGDLEEKRTKDKSRLKALGEETSDAEGNDEDEDEDEDDDEDDDDDDEGGSENGSKKGSQNDDID